MKKIKRQDKNNSETKNIKDLDNKCPHKDEDGNCLVPGVYSDSDPIGGGG